MIVFDLACRAGSHRFEGWFGSSEDFAAQQQRGLVACPQCGSVEIDKAPMAPSVGRKGNQVAVKTPTIAARPQGSSPQVMSGTAMPPEALQMMQKLAKMQAEALTKSRWVGESFAEDSRAMHYGEREAEQIHGQATIKEARDLIDEGIAVAHLPFPIAPPGEAN